MIRHYNNRSDNKYPLLPADNDAAAAIHDQCEHMAFYDETVPRIIPEEAERFLKGDTTAEATAAKIQARASLYMAEQYG